MRQVYPSLRVWLPLDPWRRAFWGQPGGCAWLPQSLRQGKTTSL